MKIKEKLNQNYQELDLLEDSGNIKEENSNKECKLYGNNINIKNPRKLGNLRAFLYIGDYPLIVLGPNSNHFY